MLHQSNYDKQRKLTKRLNLSRNYEMKPISTGHKLNSLP